MILVQNVEIFNETSVLFVLDELIEQHSNSLELLQNIETAAQWAFGVSIITLVLTFMVLCIFRKSHADRLEKLSSQDPDEKLKNFKKGLVGKLVTEYKNKIKISELDAPVPIKCEENKDQIINELSGTNLKTMDINMLVKKDENTEHDAEKEDIERSKSGLEKTIIFIPPPAVLPGPRFDPRLTARPVTAGDVADYWDSRLENDIINVPDTKERY